MKDNDIKTHTTDKIMSLNTPWEDPLRMHLSQFKGVGTDCHIRINKNANQVNKGVINHYTLSFSF